MKDNFSLEKVLENLWQQWIQEERLSSSAQDWRERITLEAPKNPQHGHLATNAPLILAPLMKCSPETVGEEIIQVLQKISWIEAVVFARPGFINVTLHASYWQALLKDILMCPESYGRHNFGQGHKVLIECLSANPTGPLHGGHGRIAVVADTIASLLSYVGYDVTREYYINDAGQQAKLLARSVHWRYLEALGRVEGDMPEAYYPGEYLIPLAQDLVKEKGDAWVDAEEALWLEPLKRWAVDKLMHLIQQDLQGLGVNIDSFVSELALHEEGKVQRMGAYLEQKDWSYIGQLPPPRGQADEDWSPHPLLLFRSTRAGDTQDRPLKRATGEWTYFAADIAYHMDKINRGFNWIVDVFGADHHSLMQRLKAAVKAVVETEFRLDVVLCQMMRFSSENTVLKMSKRSGQFVLLKDLVGMLGKDVWRLMMLAHRPDTHLEIDIDQALKAAQDNPVFYIQYAHARCCSVLRHACTSIEFDSKQAHQYDLYPLIHEVERHVMQRLSEWPKVTLRAARHLEPHRIVTYLHEIAGAFHLLWQQGKAQATLRFICLEDRQASLARLALVQAVSQVIAQGLRVLGVTPAQEL